ncbi:MAG: hypothetical protein KF726_05275 [Anaerolineae bacterium]|nr:hypothetical protein [Anaerolineae bacterium]
MSGYAISYYHFGYIMAAMLAKVSDVGSGVAFNLMVSLLFALAGTGIFGVVYDLVASRAIAQRWKAMAAGLLGTFMLVLMGNFGTTAVEVPYQLGLFPKDSAYLQFLDLQHRPADLSNCPPSGSLDPNTWCGGGWWWWTYSRVVQDRDLGGGAYEVIAENPIFSFVLSDMHPHVLSLPFTMLVVGLGLNLVLSREKPANWHMLLYGIWVGGMIFLNSWDAVYLALFVGAEALRRLINNGTGWFKNSDWRGLIGFVLTLLGLTAVLYSPFFISFRSQAGGVLPNVIWPTRFPQFFIIFAPFLFLLVPFLYVEIRRGGETVNWAFARRVLIYAIGTILVLFVGLAILAWLRPEIAGIVYRLGFESGGILNVAVEVIVRRIWYGILTHALLLGILFVVVARLFAHSDRSDEQGQPLPAINYPPAAGYALLLIAAGAFLALTPEFVYLRDGFGTRINMIFKLYYQTWSLWSVAGAYAAWSLITELSWEPVKRISPRFRTVCIALLVVVIISGVVYPAAAITTRAYRDGGHLYSDVALTLDGGPSMAMGADDYSVIQCLARVATNQNDVVAEATRRGLAYTGQFGRVSALTGIPTLLGWDNHEGQWRGDTFDAAVNTLLPGGGYEHRADAIQRLYSTTDWEEARTIIRRYGITYIFVGFTERNEHNSDGTPLFNPAGLAKFADLTPVCQSGDVAAYSVVTILRGEDQQVGG